MSWPPRNPTQFGIRCQSEPVSVADFIPMCLAQIAPVDPDDPRYLPDGSLSAEEVADGFTVTELLPADPSAVFLVDQRTEEWGLYRKTPSGAFYVPIVSEIR